MQAAGDRICSVQNPGTLGIELCRCILDKMRIAFHACIEWSPGSLDAFLNKPLKLAGLARNTWSRMHSTFHCILVADWLSSMIRSCLLRLQLRGQHTSPYTHHSHSQFQPTHEPTLRTSPISPLDKDSYCRRGRNPVALQIHTGRGSTAGGICILPQSYFLVLIAETLGHFFMGIFSIKCII